MEPPVSYNQTCLTVFLTFKDSQIVHFQNAICRIDTTAKYVNRTLHSFSDGVLWVLNISCFHIKKIVYYVINRILLLWIYIIQSLFRVMSLNSSWKPIVTTSYRYIEQTDSWFNLTRKFFNYHYVLTRLTSKLPSDVHNLLIYQWSHRNGWDQARIWDTWTLPQP